MASPLKGKRVLVTGGAGFIGSHIVDKLLDIGAQVTVLDNLLTGKLENISQNLSKIRFIQKDFTDGRALDEALEGAEFISHQAALRSVPESIHKPLEYHDINVTGTLKLLLKAREKGIKRVVFASSSAVYGEKFNFPIKETDSPQPISPYAVNKLVNEHYACLFSRIYGLESVVLRYFNVFGPRQAMDDEYSVVIPKFINSLLNNESPPVYGDGKQERDFIYVDNVVEANISALTVKEAVGEVFNVAGGVPYSINSLLKELKGIIDKDIKPVYLKPRPGDIKKSHADIKKIEKLLNWQPRVDFHKGLERTVGWFREQASGYQATGFSDRKGDVR